MDLKEIRQIIEMMKRNDLTLFLLERDGVKVKLKKGVDFDTFVQAMATGGHAPVVPRPVTFDPMLSNAAATVPGQKSPEELEGTTVAPSAPANGPTIDSPMVGTLYRASGPGEPVFVKEGDLVDEGKTVCIIEAMKVMNEIKAERTGVIARVLVPDGTAVQYGQPLFELKPA